jgi:hypothetical protein
MKLILLFICFTLSAFNLQAQTVTALPQGKYETQVRGNGKWDKGDLVLIDNAHYKISSGEETGEYHFSVTAQRVFFTSGPLRGVFARTMLSNSSPAIVLPQAENGQLGIKLASGDIIAAKN